VFAALFLLYLFWDCRRWNGCRRYRAELKLMFQKKEQNIVKEK
jgi:hypothetical protein